MQEAEEATCAAVEARIRSGMAFSEILVKVPTFPDNKFESSQGLLAGDRFAQWSL